ncbi:ubiquinol-cytochrome c reductase complex core protein [Grosmannia clavigera kw1407]|uniref:Cytochrome b-c1 complex subunit 2, mitochondrial n=1 Tax=Grosmannia clavigera (strain kw1407 / UAMH 11150) TaxID=655863 RepID=F0XA53_GROCL|nr:ubiquinol-cytochrome c reductase complex core protein [Grosmannia clavigera kw1407]EFX05369.1 ubiquinol-cytochrome c reductase complex core protein [Grosmannia clavigera kw1407]
MISRSAVSRAGQLALRRQQACVRTQTRAFAAAASGPSAFEPTDIAGVKVLSKDGQGPSTKLAVVAKAGTRYQSAPGLTAGLEGFAFKNTSKRSALRITRESELLGGQLTAYHTREAVVLEASFLREHLPYFTELLSEVVSLTKFTRHELEEDIEPVLHIQQEKYSANALARAVDGAHDAAFHSGLGQALYQSTATHVSEHDVAAFADVAYTRPNIAVVADGATQTALAKWVEPFFKTVPAAPKSAAALSTAASKYYGGQLRADSAAGNAVVIAFFTAGLNAADPAAAVLASLLGGKSSIKWAPGFSLLSKATTGLGTQVVAQNLLYSDAGLFTIQISGGSAATVRKAAEEAVKVVKSVADGSVSKEDLTKAIAKTKFDVLTAGESGSAALTAATAALYGAKAADTKAFEAVSADKLKTLAKTFLDGKASFAAVGDLHVLPYAEDVGLKV